MVGLGFNCPQCPNSLKEIRKKQMSWPKLQELSGFVQRERLGHFLKPCGNNIKACNGGVERKRKHLLYHERKPCGLLWTGMGRRVKRLLQDFLTFEESINSEQRAYMNTSLTIIAFNS